MLNSLLNIFTNPKQASVDAITPAPAADPIPRTTILSELSFLDITDHELRADHNGLIKSLWRKHVALNPPTAEQMALRNLLLGRKIDAGFSPVTSAIKIANGQAPYGALDRALWAIVGDEKTWQPWQDLWILPTAAFSHRNRLARVFGSDEAGLARIKTISAHVGLLRDQVSNLAKNLKKQP